VVFGGYNGCNGDSKNNTSDPGQQALASAAAMLRAEGLNVVEDTLYVARAAAFQGVSADALPMMYASGNTVVLNPTSSYWQQRQQIIEKMFLIHYYSTNDDNHDVWHEVGHAKHSQKDYIQYTMSAEQHVPADFYDEVAFSVSEYTLENAQELVAEIYALLHIHQQRGTSANLSEALLQYYRDIGGVNP
jgi:hypothetical protein